MNFIVKFWRKKTCKLHKFENFDSKQAILLDTVEGVTHGDALGLTTAHGKVEYYKCKHCESKFERRTIIHARFEELFGYNRDKHGWPVDADGNRKDLLPDEE